MHVSSWLGHEKCLRKNGTATLRSSELRKTGILCCPTQNYRKLIFQCISPIYSETSKSDSNKFYQVFK